MEPLTIQPVLFQLLPVPVQPLHLVPLLMEQVHNQEPVIPVPGSHPEAVPSHHVITDIHKVVIVVW